VDNNCFITIDCGTQSVRVLVFDLQGNLLFKFKSAIEEYKSLNPGWKEIHPDIIWNKICTGIKSLYENDRYLFDRVEGVTVSCQRDSVIVVDKKGKVLRDCIIWMDKRKNEEIRPMKIWANILLKLVKFKRIGDTYNREFRANWIRINEPEIWEKTDKYLLLSTYLNYRLTGRFADSTASTVGHLPFDYKRFKWAGKNDIKRQIFDLDNRYLYDLVEPCTILGKITEEASMETLLPKGLLVVATGSDKGCETIGVGCRNLEQGSISLGSQATIQTSSEKYLEIVTLFPAFPSVKKGWYNPEISIYRGFWMVKWFEEEFAQKELIEAGGNSQEAVRLLDDKLDHIPPGCDGLVLQPFWGQELLRPEAKGSIIGFHDGHTRAHLYRAIIEGIAFALLEGIETLEKKSGRKMTSIALSGGGSQSDAICQITADIFNREVYRVQTFETTGLGGAVAGFTALGKFKDIDQGIEQMVHKKSTFKPDEKNSTIYRRIYSRVYKNIYKKLKPLYEEMEKIHKHMV
jgi:sugar (pentulose or hexulose) kinase